MATSAVVSLPVSRLVHSKSNVRRTARDRGIEGLAASIAAHGLRQNLNVRPTTGNRYEVVAGGRRLEALKRLIKDGRVAQDAEVPCLIIGADENATELSLAENAMRVEMHPDDQARAFASLIDEGFTIEDIAARFGVTSRVVAQRLKLSSVSPLLRALYRQGVIDGAQMAAFAFVDDHAAQEAAWNQLPEWNRQPEAIRRALTGEGIAADHRLAKFVGVEAYRTAGGEVIEDLFEEDRPPILANGALLQVLASAKLEETATAVRLEGWSFVNVELAPNYSVSYGRVYPTIPEGSPADAEPTYSDDDLANAGARVVLSYNGTVSVDRGLVSPETMDKERKATTSGSPPQRGLSDSMVADLTAHRTAALRCALAKTPSVALAATVHALLLGVLYPTRGGQPTCLELTLRPSILAVVDPEECTAHHDLHLLLSGCTIQAPEHPDDFWAWCLAQDQETLLNLLALAAGLSVNAVSYNERAASPRLDHSHQLGDTLGFVMRDYWRPKVTGFFARLTKALMSRHLREIGSSELAADVLKLGKAAAAERASAQLMSAGWQPLVFLPATKADENAKTEEPDNHVEA